MGDSLAALGEEMVDDAYQTVKQKYESSGPNSLELFQALVTLGNEIGLDTALSLLERCVMEKRLAWVEKHRTELPAADDPVENGYRVFYEMYLHLSVPQDGAIVERSDRCMLTRWWNRCPTLEACQELGLDTREICRKVYEKPVQAMLERVDPRLRFRRNYAALRPHCAYCEEMIELVEPVEIEAENEGL